MKRLSTLAFVLGLAPAGVALAAMVGLGVLRSLGPVQIALGAAVIVVLPIVGLHAALGRKEWSAAAAVWLWPIGLLMTLPGYFPGEVAGAIGSGFGLVVAGWGPDATSRAAQFGRELRVPQGAVAPPLAASPPPPCTPAATALASDQVALPYEGQGHSLTVPIQFGDTELAMLFDTGATLTTLNRRALTRLGITVPGDAPEIAFRTANGERSVRLVLVPRVWVGGLPVEGVTVGVCEQCADESTAGLLGLNVSGQFLVTVDTVRKEVGFQAREGRQDRLVDVGPWLSVSATARLWPDGRVEVDVSADNQASRAIAEAGVGIHCGSQDFVATLLDIAPHAKATTVVRLPSGTDCDAYSVTLDHAYW